MLACLAAVALAVAESLVPGLAVGAFEEFSGLTRGRPAEGIEK